MFKPQPFVRLLRYKHRITRKISLMYFYCVRNSFDIRIRRCSERNILPVRHVLFDTVLKLSWRR